MKFRIFALTALAAFLSDACNQNPAEVAVTGITLSDDDIELIEGQTHTLVATVLPDNAANKNDVRPLKVSASGDVFLAMRDDDAALYKNGALLYSYTFGWTFYPYCIIE